VYHNISIEDTHEQQITQKHFDDGVNFIKEAIDGGGAVLIHWCDHVADVMSIYIYIYIYMCDV